MSVRFGLFHLDTENACIWRGSEALHLTPKAFAVLNILLAHPGRLVTKDELWQAVWPGVAVSDAALTVCIREIRQRLHDDARAPRVIETVHRRALKTLAEAADGKRGRRRVGCVHAAHANSDRFQSDKGGLPIRVYSRGSAARKA